MEVIESVSLTQIKALKEQRGKVVNDMRNLNELAVKEDRGFTAEEKAKWNDMVEKEVTLQTRINDMEKMIEIESRVAEVDYQVKHTETSKDENEKRYSETFRKFMVGGDQVLTNEERSILNEKRDLSKGSQGAYTVPVGFLNKVETAILTYGGVYPIAGKLPTDTGNNLTYPTINDTANSGELIAEAYTIGTSVDPTFSAVTLYAYKFSSKPVLMSSEFLADNAIDAENRVSELLGIRIGRILNTYFTTGTGSSQPQGVVNGATDSAITALVSSITFDNMVDLFHTVDPAYRANGSWMFNDATLKALRKIQDSEYRPIWQNGYVVGEPATILGRPYVINTAMANIGASAKSVLFGDFAKYIVREVRGMTLRRLVERYADTDQVAFIGFKRADGRYVDAGTHPVKYLDHAAS